jgi:hypothetical protein
MSAIDPTLAPTNPRGLTPTIVTGAPLRRTTSPIAETDREKRRDQ